MGEKVKLTKNSPEIPTVSGYNPVRHEVATRAVVLNKDVIPPSIRLDEPTTLNKERVGQSSEARKCGNQSASGGSSWEP